jgi:hypothetical protein
MYRTMEYFYVGRDEHGPLRIEACVCYCWLQVALNRSGRSAAGPFGRRDKRDEAVRWLRAVWPARPWLISRHLVLASASQTDSMRGNLILQHPPNLVLLAARHHTFPNQRLHAIFTRLSVYSMVGNSKENHHSINAYPRRIFGVWRKEMWYALWTRGTILVRIFRRVKAIYPVWLCWLWVYRLIFLLSSIEIELAYL